MVKQKEFKDTTIGRIPKEWEVVEIKKVCDFVRGTEPGSKSYNTEGLGYRFIRVSDLSKRVLEKIFTNENKEKLVFCRNDDILLVLDGVPGVVNRNFEGAVSSGIRIVNPQNTNTDKNYLFYILQHDIAQRIIENYTTGTTIKHATKAIDFIQIPLPPLPEQQKIAEILMTVDEAIQKVDEAIEKTERLKKGLMQELLTKGIGHNVGAGLCACPEKEGQPHRVAPTGKKQKTIHNGFKDTEIGKIPKGWEVVRLGVILSLEYGKGLTETQRKSGGYPVFGSNGVVGYHSDFLIKGPGIIVGRKGTIGAINWSSDNFWPIDTTYFVKLKDKNIDLKWFYYELISLNLSRLNTATGTPGLNRDLAYSQNIPLPPLPEQQKISEILSTVDNKLELLREKKQRFEKIKRGLMDELLTGRKRV